MDRTASEPVFDAVLYPHRSLSPRGFALMMGALGGAAGTVAIYFAAAGAWPGIPFFCGCPALIWWASRAHGRDARPFANLQLTTEALTVVHATTHCPAGEPR